MMMKMKCVPVSQNNESSGSLPNGMTIMITVVLYKMKALKNIKNTHTKKITNSNVIKNAIQ